MTSLRILALDPEGRPIQFDLWLNDLQLFLLSDSRDSVSLFDHTSGAAPAPPTTGYKATSSQWLTRDAAARLVIRNHLPLAECTHFIQHMTAQALYDAVVARYSSPATISLGRLLLPYLFPELSAFARVEDLVSHLCTSDARYRAALPAEFLAKSPPPMYITLYFIVTRLPDSLRATSVVAVGAACGTLRTPFFEGCSPSPLSPSYASAVAADDPGAADVGAASASAKRRSSKGKGGRGGGGGSGGGDGGSSGGGGGSGGGGSGGSGGGSGGFGGGGGGSGASGGSGSGGSGGGRTRALRGGSGGGQRQQQQRRSETPSPQQLRDHAGQTCRKLHTQHRCFSRLNDARRAEFGDEAERPHWAELLRTRVAIFDLYFDSILAAMYALSASAEGDCYLCVPPDPGIEAAALGATESVLPGTASAEALHTFATAPPSLLSLHLSLSGFHLPTFSTNLVSTAALRDAMVTTTAPGGHRVSICTSTQKGRHLVTFTHRPGSSLYTLATKPPHVAASAQVSASGQVAPPCSCHLLSHQTLLWHHRLGHPSLPCLRGMHSRLLVSGLPRSLPPLPPSPAPPCLPCVEGRQRAAPHSSSFPPTTAPLQTLHIDVWSPARVSGQGRERYFLLRFRTGLPVLHLHSNRGGEFSSNLLREFCRGEGILQSFTLPDSPQQNGITERRIGLVSKVARTSMIHAVAPHFLWSFAVRYAAHQLNLWPRVSLPETSPTLRWTGKVCDASVFRVWGSRAFVRDTPADKLSARAIPCGLAPSGVSQVDPLPCTAPVEVAVGSGAAPGVASGGAESGGAEPWGAGSEGAGSGGAKLEGAESEGAGSGADGAGVSAAGHTGAGGAGVTSGGGGTGVAGTGGVGGAGTGDPTEPGAAGAGGAGAVGAGAGGTVRPRPYFIPLLQQVLDVPSSLDQSQPPLQPASPLLAPSPYTEKTGGLTERREPASRCASPVRTGRRIPRLRPPPVPSTHAMALRPSSVPLRSTAASALVAASWHLDYATALIAESEYANPPPVEDPNAPEIPNPRSYAEAIMGLYSSQWQAAMDAEMASWKSTCTYVNTVPPSRANIVDGIQRQGVNYFQTFLQGSLHKEIWLHHPPGITGSQCLTIGRLLLPYLFPELSAFATVEDLVSPLRTSDARYRAALPAEFLTKNRPPMYITLYYIVTRLPDSLRAVRDHFLTLDPRDLTVELLEQHLLAAETSVVAVGAARGTPRTPFLKGCSPFPLAPSYASATAVDVLSTEDVRAASTSAKRHSGKGKGGRSGGGGSGSGGGGSSGGNGGSGGGGSGGSGGGSGAVGGSRGGSGGSGGCGSSGSGGGRTGAQRGGSRGGQRLRQQRRSETPSPQQLREWLFQRGASGGSVSCPYFGDEVERPHWAELLRSGVAIFDLDHDAILSAMYALSASAEGDCYWCVLPEPCIEAAALGASESSLPGTAPTEALHTFTLDSSASHCFFRGTPPSLLSLHLSRSDWLTPPGARTLPVPPLSSRVRRTAALKDAMVTTTTPGGQCLTICTCTWMCCHLATFTRRPGSSLYTLATEPPHVAASSQVSASGLVAPSCSCRLLLHQTLLWYHRLGHPSLPRLRGMHSRLLVSSLPRSLLPLPPFPALPCLPCVEGRQRAAPHSSSPPTIAPLQTLHMDVWGPARVSGQGRERYFLLVVDDYTRYTTVFLLRSKGQVVDVLIPWIRVVRLQLRERTLRISSTSGPVSPSCTDLDELRSYLGLQITQDRARRTIKLTQSHIVHQVLQRFGFLFSSPQRTPLSSGHSLSAPPSDESVEPSGPYRELVGCLITSGMGLVLGGHGPVFLIGHADASWIDDSATQRSSQGYTFSLGSGSVSWRSTRSSSVLSSSCEAEIYARAMAAQELRWLTCLLTELGEQPRSPPVLYIDNKAMLALCQEHRLEHRTKHIALRYFLARELQQRGQLRLAYVAIRANTADIFTKALPPGDHQRFSTLLGLLPTLPHLLTA
ncbi:unnamed protein product [Closterium sp. NIES-54]